MTTIMKSLKVFGIVIILSAFNLTVSAQTQSKQIVRVAEAVQQLVKAMESGEQSALEAITSDGLSYGHSGGGVETK